MPMEQGKVKTISGPRGFVVPSHCLYADDVMIFCRGNKSSISALIDLFQRYLMAFSQFVNPSKY